MTPTQKKVLAYIHKRQSEGVNPSLSEIAIDVLGSPYRFAAQKMVNALVELGYVRKDRLGRIRFWTPLSLPCYSM